MIAQKERESEVDSVHSITYQRKRVSRQSPPTSSSPQSNFAEELEDSTISPNDHNNSDGIPDDDYTELSSSHSKAHESFTSVAPESRSANEEDDTQPEMAFDMFQNVQLPVYGMVIDDPDPEFRAVALAPARPATTNEESICSAIARPPLHNPAAPGFKFSQAPSFKMDANRPIPGRANTNPTRQLSTTEITDPQRKRLAAITPVAPLSTDPVQQTLQNIRMKLESQYPTERDTSATFLSSPSPSSFISTQETAVVGNSQCAIIQFPNMNRDANSERGAKTSNVEMVPSPAQSNAYCHSVPFPGSLRKTSAIDMIISPEIRNTKLNSTQARRQPGLLNIPSSTTCETAQYSSPHSGNRSLPSTASFAEVTHGQGNSEVAKAQSSQQLKTQAINAVPFPEGDFDLSNQEETARHNSNRLGVPTKAFTAPFPDIARSQFPVIKRNPAGLTEPSLAESSDSVIMSSLTDNTAEKIRTLVHRGHTKDEGPRMDVLPHYETGYAELDEEPSKFRFDANTTFSRSEKNPDPEIYSYANATYTKNGDFDTGMLASLPNPNSQTYTPNDVPYKRSSNKSAAPTRPIVAEQLQQQPPARSLTSSKQSYKVDKSSQYRPNSIDRHTDPAGRFQNPRNQKSIKGTFIPGAAQLLAAAMDSFQMEADYSRNNVEIIDRQRTYIRELMSQKMKLEGDVEALTLSNVETKDKVEGLQAQADEYGAHVNSFAKGQKYLEKEREKLHREVDAIKADASAKAQAAIEKIENMNVSFSRKSREAMEAARLKINEQETTIQLLRKDIDAWLNDFQREKGIADKIQKQLDDRNKFENTVKGLLLEHQTNILTHLSEQGGQISSFIGTDNSHRKRFEDCLALINDIRDSTSQANPRLDSLTGLVENLSDSVQTRFQDAAESTKKLREARDQVLIEFRLQLDSLKVGQEANLKLNDALAELQDRNVVLSEKLQSREVKIAKLVSEINQIKPELSACQDEVLAKTNELKMAWSVIPEDPLLRPQLQRLETTCSSLKDQLDTANKKIARAEEELHDEREMTRSGQEKFQELSVLLQQTRSKEAEFELERAELLKSKAAEIDKLREDMKRDFESRIQQVEAGYSSQIVRLEQEKNEAATAHSTQLADLEEQHSKANEYYSAHQATLDKQKLDTEACFAMQLASFERQILQIETEKDTIQRLKLAAEVELVQIRNKLVMLQQSSIFHETTASNLRADIEGLESRIRAQKAEIEVRDRDVRSIQEHYHSAASELQFAQDETNLLKTDLLTWSIRLKDEGAKSFEILSNYGTEKVQLSTKVTQFQEEFRAALEHNLQESRRVTNSFEQRALLANTKKTRDSESVLDRNLVVKSTPALRRLSKLKDFQSENFENLVHSPHFSQISQSANKVEGKVEQGPWNGPLRENILHNESSYTKFTSPKTFKARNLQNSVESHGPVPVEASPNSAAPLRPNYLLSTFVIGNQSGKSVISDSQSSPGMNTGARVSFRSPGHSDIMSGIPSLTENSQISPSGLRSTPDQRLQQTLPKDPNESHSLLDQTASSLLKHAVAPTADGSDFESIGFSSVITKEDHARVFQPHTLEGNQILRSSKSDLSSIFTDFEAVQKSVPPKQHKGILKTRNAKHSIDTFRASTNSHPNSNIPDTLLTDPKSRGSEKNTNFGSVATTTATARPSKPAPTATKKTLSRPNLASQYNRAVMSKETIISSSSSNIYDYPETQSLNTMSADGAPMTVPNPHRLPIMEALTQQGHFPDLAPLPKSNRRSTLKRDSSWTQATDRRPSKMRRH